MAFGWKVCFISENGEYLSAIAMGINEIKYHIGEYVSTKAKCRPLAVFDSYNNAFMFALCKPFYLRIIPCEYIPTDNIPEWANRIPLPEGTIFADAVRIF